MVEDICHEGLRSVLREKGVSFQALKAWKTSTDPDFEAKKNRVLHLYQISDGKIVPEEGDPTVYAISKDRLYGHIKTRKSRTELLAFCRHLRSLYPADVRIPIASLGWTSRISDLRLPPNNRGTVLCYIR